MFGKNTLSISLKGEEMSKKLYLPLALLMVFSMLLGACTPTAAETPVVTAAPIEPPTEVPTEAVPTEPPLDIPGLLAAFWTTVPADKGYGSVAAAKLSEEFATAVPFLVDVREASELEKDGYIEGAINIPIRTLLQNLDKLPGLDQSIVIYCGSGHRGAFGMMALKMLGYTNVRNLGGGIGAWKKANLPVVTGSLPAAPAAISTPIVADQQLFAVLDGFLTNLPEGFASIKSDALAAELADKPPFLVDIRSAAEWNSAGYIAGAVHIAFPDFLNNLGSLPAEKDARIVIYCGSGHRGAMAEMALYLLGYTDVVNLGGGIGAWKTAGLPVSVDWPAVLGEFVTALPADQGFYSITATALNELLAAGTPPFLVDVREASEVEATGYIAGAIHLPIRDLLKNLDKLPAKDQKIVIYCGSGHRGALGMVALRLLGYTDVVNLGGGTGAWTKAAFAYEPGLPAAPAAGTAPAVDAARFAALDTYLGALPQGFGAVKAPDLNTELAGATLPTIVDVRTPEEVAATGYIAGALLIPINTLPASLAQLPADKAAPIVVTCKSGHRGAIAMMYLNFLGYTAVRNLGGGMNGWIAAELPVVK
jgi:rhodanese-related sulfurtransferase